MNLITGLDRLSELKQTAATYEQQAKQGYRDLIGALETSDPSELRNLIEKFREQMAVMINKAYVSELEKFLPI
jgi:F0F1-type ATP synthase membrane subunit b/b'